MISSSRTIARIRFGVAPVRIDRSPRRARPAVPAGVALLAAASVLLAASPAGALPRPFPAPRGYLSDFAGIVDAASADSIDALARELSAKSGAELAVATLPDLGGETIDPVATDLFAQWGVGRKGKDDGVLILLALAERKVRIEVGYDLEGALPDGRCGAIIRKVMGPDLTAGRYGPGLLLGARAVAGVIAVERGVTITGSIAPPEDGESEGREVPAWVLFLVIVVIVVIITLARAASGPGPGGPYRDWRSRRGGWRDPWGGFGGGWGGMGGFGGGGGGGGGFGGFGGGRSGGGGASGGF